MTFLQVLVRLRWSAFLLVLGMFLIFLDFVSKAYIYNCLSFIQGPGRGIPVLTHFLGGIDFSINLAFNRGAAWGLFAHYQLPLLILRMSVIGALFCYLFFMNKNKRLLLPFVLILAGAIGNVIDFFLYGFVIDFFLFNFWGWDFPLFNVADSLITIGVSLLFIESCRKECLSATTTSKT